MCEQFRRNSTLQTQLHLWRVFGFCGEERRADLAAGYSGGRRALRCARVDVLLSSHARTNDTHIYRHHNRTGISVRTGMTAAEAWKSSRSRLTAAWAISSGHV